MHKKAIFCLFFISGFTALVFEVVWSRQACLIFGNTTFASAAVIAAFMTGLALGSFLFGKLADAKPELSLRLYGVLEGGIGIFALIFPLLVAVLTPLYSAIYHRYYENFLLISMIRFGLSFVILIIPTTLMGGTFPLLSRFLGQSAQTMKENINKLYAMNLFGAMAGSFASGFILISAFGLLATSAVAACLNLGIFLYVFLVLLKSTQADGASFVRERRKETPVGPLGSPFDKKTIILITVLMVVHGFSAFVIQICWTRTMALILGSSTYSFSAMLTTFLAGLGLGTYAISYWMRRNIKLSLPAIGFMEIAVGTSVLLFIPAFEWLIYFFVRIFPVIQLSIILVFITQFIFCVIAMIVPTFLMGLVYPAVFSYLGEPEDIGEIVGTTYAVNTAGGVLGCFMAAFFFISHFGINGSLHFVSMLSIFAGFLVVAVASDKLRRKINVGKAATAAVLSMLLLLYPWDKNMFSSGVFIYASSWADETNLGKAMFQKLMNAGSRLIYYRDGISSTVSVLQYDLPSGKGPFKAKSLRVNGKTDASTMGDMATQLYLGYIPLFAHPDPKNVLVIGLGAGVSLGTATQFPSVKDIECVEIEPAVIEANRYFTAENNYALKDPRVKLIVGDGRNHISFSPKKYDVIISEPSNPWISGIASLFSKENYTLALDRLTPDGIYCQWFHAYQMSKEDFIMIIHTFASVFPKVNLFKVSGSDYFLLGSRKDITFDYQKMMRLIQENKYIQSDLKFFSEHEEHFIIGSFLLSDRDLREALSKERPRLNTDNHLFLEYNAPKYMYKRTSEEIYQWLYSIPRRDVFPDFYGWDKEKILNSPGIWKIFYSNGISALQAKNYDVAIEFLKEAERLNPGETRIPFTLGRVYESKKQYTEAVRYYKSLETAKEWDPLVKSAFHRATIKEKMESAPIMHRSVELHNLIAGLSFLMGDMEEAIREMELAINIDPTFVKNYADMATFYFMKGYGNEGLAMLRRGEKIDPNHPALKKARDMWEKVSKNREIMRKLQQGRVYLADKDYAQAKHYFEAVVQEDPSNIVAYAFLSESELGLGQVEAAQQHHAKAVELRSKYMEQMKKAAEERTGKAA